LNPTLLARTFAESALLLNSMHCIESNQWLVVGHVQLVDHDFSLVQTGDWLQASSTHQQMECLLAKKN
jgi:hypothetical protein